MTRLAVTGIPEGVEVPDERYEVLSKHEWRWDARVSRVVSRMGDMDTVWRVATRHKRKRAARTSRYRGVSRLATGRFAVQLGGKWVGSYGTEEEAVEAVKMVLGPRVDPNSY